MSWEIIAYNFAYLEKGAFLSPRAFLIIFNKALYAWSDL